ncbi:MAG: hypothetical protein IJE62_07285 [Clostridia bacterium]|nr:hypothetical protein [Clostridia bacterium]
MKLKPDVIKSHAEDLVKIAEEAESKAKQQPLTREEFLQFLKDFQEKNSLIMKELGLDEFI